MRCATLALAAAALVGLAAAPANAAQTKGLIYASITGPELVEVMQGAGYRADLGADSSGNPQIDSSSNGVDFQVYFYGCDQAAVRECDSFDISAGFDLAKGFAVASINQWNRDKRFAAAYLDDEDDPFLNMYVNLDGGVTAEMILDSLDIWNDLLGEFKTLIGW